MTDPFNKLPKVEGVDEDKEKPKKRILLADDDPGIRKLMTRLLTLSGYQVDTVENGQLLLDKLNSGDAQYDLVVSDNSMPSLTGIQALRQIRADSRLKDLKVILQTSDDVEAEVKSLGGRYVFKGHEELVGVVNNMLSDSVK